MTRTISQERFRQAAESEGGIPVSAGARVAHVRSAVDSGRAVFVDLSRVPEVERPAVVASIQELVTRASDRTTRSETSPSLDASNQMG